MKRIRPADAEGDSAAAYPVRIAPNRRYLVDQRGMPFLLHGEAAWSLVSALRREEAERYLADRAAKGINSILCNLIEHKFNGPMNRYGEAPFLGRGTLTSPNEAYFEHADWVVQRAGEYGMQVLLAPMYLGLEGTDEGWIEEVLGSGEEGCREWGRYLGQRYARFDNIIWVLAGDRLPGSALACVNACAAGIRQHDRRHLFTGDSAPERSAADDFGREGWLDLNNTYSYGIVHRRLMADYHRQPVRPFFLKGTSYEGEHHASPVQIRRQAYWALLCGACGQIFGNRPIWLFDAGWEEALQSAGSLDMVRLRALFGARPWYHLVPDDRHELVVDGLGELRGLDTVAAARTSCGGTAIVYMPSARAIRVDLARMRGGDVWTLWYNPRTGESCDAGGYATSGVRAFVPPSEGDWVLVVDDAGQRLPMPGVPGVGRET